MSAWIAGGDWIEAATDHVPAVWGDGDRGVWAHGEPLLIAGPPGVGKTTVAQQLTLALCGATETLDLLGLGVSPLGASGRRVAYLACDRPRQRATSEPRLSRQLSRTPPKSRPEYPCPP